jgi:hypothetical protein
MSDDVDLRNFRYVTESIVAAEFRGDYVVEVRLFDIQLRKAIADAAGLRTLEDQGFVLSGMLRNFLDGHIPIF